MTTAKLSIKSGPIPAYLFIKKEIRSILGRSALKQKGALTKHAAIASLYERPSKYGAGTMSRTRDLLITSQLQKRTLREGAQF